MRRRKPSKDGVCKLKSITILISSDFHQFINSFQVLLLSSVLRTEHLCHPKFIAKALTSNVMSLER